MTKDTDHIHIQIEVKAVNVTLFLGASSEAQVTLTAACGLTLASRVCYGFIRGRTRIFHKIICSLPIVINSLSLAKGADHIHIQIEVKAVDVTFWRHILIVNASYKILISCRSCVPNMSIIPRVIRMFNETVGTVYSKQDLCASTYRLVSWKYCFLLRSMYSPNPLHRPGRNLQSLNGHQHLL